MKSVSLGIVGLGFVLLIASGVWPMLFRGSSSWTEEKALRAAEVKARLNNLGPIVNSTKPSMHRGEDTGTLKAEFDALILEEQQLNEEFESARDSPKTSSKILKWSGIGLAVIGLFGWYAMK
jgi:hypothetical protein